MFSIPNALRRMSNLSKARTNAIPAPEDTRHRFRNGDVYHVSEVPYSGKRTIGRYKFKPHPTIDRHVVACRKGKPVKA